MQNYYLLKHHKNYFGFVDYEKHYVVGFNQHHLNYLLRNNITKKSKACLIRNHTEDVTQDINAGLIMKGVSQTISGVTIDVGAKLIITKDEEFVEKDDVFEIDHVQIDNFILWPFQNNLGVVLTTDLYTEDKDKYVFTSQIIDPCQSSEMFLKKLETL